MLLKIILPTQLNIVKFILPSRFLAHVEEMEDHQSILESPALELDDFPEIASFHDSQDTYMREINQPNIYSKLDIKFSTPIDTPAWYHSNSSTQESGILLPFSNP